MALSKGAVVLFVSRLLTLVFAGAAVKTFVYDSSDLSTPFPISALGMLSFALGCHITTCIVELGGLAVSVLKGWNPLPGDSGLRFCAIILDFVLGVFTYGSATAAAAVTVDFANRPRIMVHVGLACLAGLSGLFTALYSYLISVPRRQQHHQQPPPPAHHQQAAPAA